jgi:hypothetical protein
MSKKNDGSIRNDDFVNLKFPSFLPLEIISYYILFPDAISESNPRVIHEDRARKLSNELKRCTYYETCATYGLNVERVFHDGE